MASEVGPRKRDAVAGRATCGEIFAMRADGSDLATVLAGLRVARGYISDAQCSIAQHAHTSQMAGF